MAAIDRSLFRVVLLLVFLAVQSFAADQKIGASNAPNKHWSIQVAEVQSVDANMDPVFRIAIYENLLAELAKTSNFKAIYRTGDRSINLDNLLILRVTVHRFEAGSETRRAITTVAGATKITADFQLEMHDGRILKEELVHGNVRFVGSNMSATRKLAHSVASKIKASRLPEPAPIDITALVTQQSAADNQHQ
jgi:hypothetical protein